MADFYRFIIGKADSTSTPNAPVLLTTDYYEFLINPENWAGVWQGGVMNTTISGNPRVSTTQLPKDSVKLVWPKLSASAKRDKCDYYFLMNQKLILIDDQRYMTEVVVTPGSYSYNRRRSTKAAAETYQLQVQVISLGIGRQLSESEREAL